MGWIECNEIAYSQTRDVVYDVRFVFIFRTECIEDKVQRPALK